MYVQVSRAYCTAVETVNILTMFQVQPKQAAEFVIWKSTYYIALR